jgi:hypothetical protein
VILESVAAIRNLSGFIASLTLSGSVRCKQSGGTWILDNALNLREWLEITFLLFARASQPLAVIPGAILTF